MRQLENDLFVFTFYVRVPKINLHTIIRNYIRLIYSNIFSDWPYVVSNLILAQKFTCT